MFVSIILFLCIGICTITDILRKTVDIRVLLAFSLILAVCCYFEKNYNIESFVAGISILSRGAVGMGDVCLYSIIICFIGVQKGIFVLFLSIAFAFFVALFFVIVKRKKKDYEMPLVPFVLAAYLFSLFENMA
mgnify:CR=1 FL=1